MSVTASISHFLLLPVGMGWLKASAPLNMFVVFVMAVKSQFWMVFVPPLLNVFVVFVMAVKSQFWMVFVPPLLNALAPWNMPSMDVTAIVTHLLVAGRSSWLNATAPLNMFFMF